MEAYKIHVIIIRNSGEKKFYYNIIWAMTGWEAFDKAKAYILKRNRDIRNISLIGWKVLNPFMCHFK